MKKNISGFFRNSEKVDEPRFPLVRVNDKGEERKMGLEIEFSGMSIDRIIILLGIPKVDVFTEEHHLVV